ncbi:MAG: HPr family phosphocarrier protein [Lachnospiraceae bacterium]
MKKEIIRVELKNGLEATPAAMLVQIASTFESKIYLQSEDGTVKVNAKSIMGMMSMGLSAGENVIVTAEGTDEEAAVAGIAEYLSGNKPAK